MEAYGLKLLQWIASEIQYQSLSKLIVPVAVVAIPESNSLSVTSNSRTNSSSEGNFSLDPFAKKRTGLVTALDQVRTIRYMDVGAVDVLTSPLLYERLPSLAVHAYRAHKDASKEQRALLELKRGRKRSWVGVDDQKPYAYLREAMVSGLMDGICKIGGDDEPFGHIRIAVALDRREKIAAAVGSWNFSAHEFTDDELLHAALLMLQHALAMPELERWRLSTGKRSWSMDMFRMSCDTYADTRRRESNRIPGSKPPGIQCLCTLPQFPPCRRCLAGNIPLLGPVRQFTIVPEFDNSNRSKSVTNCSSHPTFRCPHAINHCHWP